MVSAAIWFQPLPTRDTRYFDVNLALSVVFGILISMEHPKSPKEIEAITELRQSEDCVAQRTGAEYVQDPGADKPRLEFTAKQVGRASQDASVERITSIEKNEIRVRYKELYEGFDAETQEKFGIKGIRKKIITEAPKDFWEHFKRYDEIFYALTEGEFPSFSTWNHAMWGDGGDPRRDGYQWRQFLAEGEYFQKIHGEVRAEKERRIPIKERYHDAEGVFNLVTLVSADGCWRDSDNCPVFVFGSKNKRFKDYLKQISESPPAQRMLKLAGWSFGPGLALGEKLDPADQPLRLAPGERNTLKDKWITKNTPFAYALDEVGAPEVDTEILHEIMQGIKRPEKLARIYWSLLNDKEAAIRCLVQSLEARREKASEYNGGTSLLPMYIELGRHAEAERVFREIIDKDPRASERYRNITAGATDLLERGVGVVNAIEYYIHEYHKEGLATNMRAEPPSFEEVYKSVWPYHFDNLLFLSQGIPCAHGLREMTIPAVTHPDVQPLRWCDADLEMVKNDEGQLEVRFFETD